MITRKYIKWWSVSPQKVWETPSPTHTHCCDVPWKKFTPLQSLGDVHVDILHISEKILLALCYSKCLDRNAFCWFKHVYMYEYYIFVSWVQFSYRHRLKPCHEIDLLWFYALLLSISPHFFVDNLLENKCLSLKGLKNSWFSWSLYLKLSIISEIGSRLNDMMLIL